MYIACKISEENSTDSLLNLFVTIGDDVFIPCLPALGTGETLNWRINGSIFVKSTLHIINHEAKDDGVIAFGISFRTKVVYECINKYHKVISTIHVTSSKSQASIPGNICSKYLKLVINGVNLNHQNSNYDFEFRIADTTMQQLNYCRPGDVTFILTVTDGSQSLWKNDTKVFPPMFSLPREVFNENNVHVEVYGINSSGQVCAQLNNYFTVNTTGKNN